MRHLSFISAIVTLALTSPVYGQDAELKARFVEANVLSIFYHELGHAVIDLMEVPIFGQEEDAADVMAVLLIDWMFEEDDAQAIAYDSAFGFIHDPAQTEDVAYWDLHGPDEQRFYNHVCLFYGANPDARESLAMDLGLPAERAETCPEEHDLAASSWGVIFDEMEGQGQSAPMVFAPGAGEFAPAVNQLLADEVSTLNADLHLPQEIIVRVESCGEPNAFYDPEDISVTICTEFIPHLEDLFDQLAND